MRPKKKDNEKLIFIGIILFICILDLGIHMGQYAHMNPDAGMITIAIEGLNETLNYPLEIFPIYNESFTYIGFMAFIALAIGSYTYFEDQKKHHDLAGAEHGRAYFDDNYAAFNKEFADPIPSATPAVPEKKKKKKKSSFLQKIVAFLKKMFKKGE